MASLFRLRGSAFSLAAPCRPVGSLAGPWCPAVSLVGSWGPVSSLAGPCRPPLSSMAESPAAWLLCSCSLAELGGTSDKPGSSAIPLDDSPIAQAPLSSSLAGTGLPPSPLGKPPGARCPLAGSSAAPLAAPLSTASPSAESPPSISSSANRVSPAVAYETGGRSLIRGAPGVRAPPPPPGAPWPPGHPPPPAPADPAVPGRSCSHLGEDSGVRQPRLLTSHPATPPAGQRPAWAGLPWRRPRSRPPARPLSLFPSPSPSPSPSPPSLPPLRAGRVLPWPGRGPRQPAVAAAALPL